VIEKARIVEPIKLGIVTAFPPGKNSLNEFGWHLASNFADKEEVEEILLYCDETQEGKPTEVKKTTPVVCWKFNSITNLLKIVKAARKTKPDAVIFNLQFASFGDSKIAGGLGLLAPAALKLMKIPTAVILHNLVENVDMQDAGFTNNKAMAKIMNLAGRALTKALLRADYVALTIPKYVELIQENYGTENVLLAPHGSFEKLDEPNFETPDGPRQLLAFGKWGTYKTVDILIEAYRELLTRGYDNLEVIVAGTDSPNSPGYLAGIKEISADLPGVKFTGYVEEEDVAGLFTNSTMTVFPYTSTTGSSGVLHQAGSYGRSAVLPDIGDFAEVIEEEGFIGEYFKPDDKTSLADAIAKLLDDETKRTEMGKQNFSAAAGIPFSDVLDWHLIHLQKIIDSRLPTLRVGERK